MLETMLNAGRAELFKSPPLRSGRLRRLEQCAPLSQVGAGSSLANDNERAQPINDVVHTPTCPLQGSTSMTGRPPCA